MKADFRRGRHRNRFQRAGWTSSAAQMVGGYRSVARRDPHATRRLNCECRPDLSTVRPFKRAHMRILERKALHSGPGQEFAADLWQSRAAKRYFSATNGTNVPNETLVALREILPVFVLLVPYGNPGSIPGQGTTPPSRRRRKTIWNPNALMLVD
jgi:hypothetical protein